MPNGVPSRRAVRKVRRAGSQLASALIQNNRDEKRAARKYGDENMAKASEKGLKGKGAEGYASAQSQINQAKRKAARKSDRKQARNKRSASRKIARRTGTKRGGVL